MKQSIFTPDVHTTRPDTVLPSAPVTQYARFIRPSDDADAKALGDLCAQEVKANVIGDFEKSEAYCRTHPGETPDRMVHVSTFVILDGVVYMTYYANAENADEDPSKHAARLAYRPFDDPKGLTVLELQKVGDMLEGKRVDLLYDTILLHKGGNELYILWTAAIEGNYYRLYCVYDIAAKTVGPIRINRFRVGEVTGDFSTTGMISALAENGITRRTMFSDIGIMQKLTAREEDGETYYYTGAYSGNDNCIIKSRDLVTWEYVAAPDFVNNSLWENAVYVLGDRCYYFVRQQECTQGFLTCYDLKKKTWATPILIADSQSRSDFIFYHGQLYLIHSPVNREGFGIVRVDTEDIVHSEVVLVADMKESLFYPYTLVYGDDAYISYTVGRRHIRLSRFDLKKYLR